ncbi:MAG: hypothetical protein AB7H92_17425 [Microbacteriaceae bacterium]
MTVPHPSDSTAQRDAEPLIIAAVAEYVGIELAAAKIDLGDGVQVQVDGASADRSVLVEAYAHVGPLRSGQSRKLTTDAFKLVWAGGRLGATRLVIAVADVDAEVYLLRPRAWLTAALRDSGVEVLRVSIDAAATARVVEAQRVQFR